MTSPLENYEFKPLTREQIVAKNKVKEAYTDFWNSIQFKKGWNNPPFERSEVESPLDSAADIVTRIRSCLDEKDPSFKLRMLDGSAREYLWGLDSKPKHNIRFIKSLVRATFRDAHGYVEGLKVSDIDKFIQRYWDYQKTVQDSQKEDIRVTFNNTWSHTCNVVKELVESELFKSKSAKDISDETLNNIQNMIKGMHHLQNKAEQLMNHQNKMDEQPQVTSSSGVSTPSSQTDNEESMEQEKIDTQDKSTQQQQNENVVQDEDKDSSPKKSDDSLLKIKIVAEDVANLKTRIQDLTNTAKKLENKNLSQDGEKVVEELQKKCLHYAEELMNDLFKLDSISSSPESRPHRKEQVTNIQSMMEEVDSLKHKLHTMLQQLRDEKKKKEEQERKEREQKERELKEQKEKEWKEKEEKLKQDEEALEKFIKDHERKTQENESNKRNIYLQTRESRLKDKWRQLKLDPNLQVNELADCYVIQGYLPGMKKEDIKIQFSKDRHSLSLEGIRFPSPMEEEQLRQSIRKQLLQDPFLRSQLNQLTQEDEDMLVLRSGLGRFGRFSETYQLPSSVDIENIDASYDKGVFKVVLPKFQIRSQMKPRQFSSPFGQFSHSGHFNDPFVMDESNWW